MRFRIAGPALAAIAALAFIGCSSTTGGSAAPAASGVAPTTAASEAAPSEAAPSEAAPSEAAPSEAAASEVIPNFAFPSTDKELEALIPDTLCGQKVQKLSMSGDQVFSDSADPGLVAALHALGKTTKDVSAAAGFPLEANPHCGVIIIRIKGADEGKLKQIFKDQAAKEGTTYTEVSIGGKTVATSDPSSFDYTYVKGDGVVVVTADSEKNAAEVISAMP
jgi:hypothetical protein